MNSLELIYSQFHFLRPLWLAAIFPIYFICLFMWHQKRKAQEWQQMIAPEFLTYLLDGHTTRIKPWLLVGLACLWTLACLALAGPTWEKRPTQVEQNQQALVILLDLSPSMMSEDIKPSRLVRARLKITDILRARKDGQTALIAYAGEAHVVTPLTDDVETINNIVPALHPNVMPLPGSNTEAAVARALQLLKDAGVQQGDILLITDDVAVDAQATIRNYFKQQPNYRLSILGVGGLTPAPIPSGKGSFMRDNQRNLVTTFLNPEPLKKLATHTAGRYATIANNDSDIKYLMNLPTPQKEETTRVEREFDNWYDQGHWLVFLLLPFVLYSFRRGLLLVLICIPLSGLMPQKSYAFSWDDLWKNKNQQALEELNQNNPAAAAEKFTDEEWQGSANYRAGNYAEAAKQFAKEDNADAYYNQGNALAKSGQLEQAIKAYNEALKRNPALTDAEKNRAIVKKVIKQQQQNQQGGDKDNKDKNDQEKDDQQQNQQQQNGNQQNQDNNKDSQQNDQQQNNQQQNSADQNKDSNQNQQSSEQNPPSDQQYSSEKNSDEKTEEQKAAEQQAQEDKEKQEAEEERAAQKAQEEKDGDKTEDGIQAQETTEDNLTEEERQAMDQWLRRVPDDPGGLLRNKFKYQYYKNRQDMHNGDFQPPENDAADRW